MKRGECQTTLPETCMWMKKQQLEPDMEQQTGSNLGKVYIKAIYFHPAYLTSMQSTSYEILGWMKCKLESRLPEEIAILQICRCPTACPSLDGEPMETVTDYFLGLQITADGNCSHEIKRCLLPGRKVMTNLDSILKSRDITLLTKGLAKVSQRSV